MWNFYLIQTDIYIYVRSNKMSHHTVGYNFIKIISEMNYFQYKKCTFCFKQEGWINIKKYTIINNIFSACHVQNSTKFAIYYLLFLQSYTMHIQILWVKSCACWDITLSMHGWILLYLHIHMYVSCKLCLIRSNV